MTLFRDRPELLPAFRRGDRSALEAVYWAYVDRVERLIRGGWRTATGEHVAAPGSADVADLVQETFARAFTERARLAFDGLREFAPYLATIARNLLVDWARRRGREVTADIGDLPSTSDPGPDEEQPWADESTMKKVVDYIEGLPSELREIHTQRYLHGRSQRDAATALGISRQQLRTREQRLRDGLRRVLDRR
jgi:RNA polymerase sigma-70 factor, ECF subfamily